MKILTVTKQLLSALAVISLSACGGGGAAPTPPPPTTFTVGGSVSGLLGSDVVLQNNGGNDLTVSADGIFTFAGNLVDDSAYSVTVLTQPASPSQTCSVSDGAGTIGGSNVSAIAVACTTDVFGIAGTVSGLMGTGLTLRNNGGDDLAVNNDGQFAFSNPVASGNGYDVTVLDHPTNSDQSCVVVDGSGVVGNTDVSSITISCTALAITRIDAGGWVSCAILENDQAKCWGHNGFGNLGLGDGLTRGSFPNEMGNDLDYVHIDPILGSGQIAAGNQSCAIFAFGRLKCWGRNDSGQLGVGDTNNRGDDPNEMDSFLTAIDLGLGRSAVQVGTGGGHVCALLDNDRIKCWGRNGVGQLGLGDTDLRGVAAGEMGDDLPETEVGSSFRFARQLTVGTNHNCVILDNDRIKCWGSNDGGQLGLGDVDHRGDEVGEMGQVLPAIDLGTGRVATQVVAGNAHSCALLDNGRVKCWGLNSAGQLGIGDINIRGDDPDEMGDNLASVELGSVNFSVTQLAAGLNHTCALISNGQVKCWGRNTVGQLGLLDLQNRGDQANEMGFDLPFIDLGTGRTATSISAGFSHTCALLDTNEMKCWGQNHHGQLGRESTQDIGDGPDEMGDNLNPIDIGSL